MGKHISGQPFSRVSVRGIAITAASILAVGAFATTSAVSRNASADTAPVGGLPATVSADALPTVQINGVAWAQVTVGNTVYVTGSFTQARPAGIAVGGTGSVTRSNLLAYDITTGTLITTFNHTLNSQGLAITASPNGSTVYVVGDFTTVDGVTHNRIAAFSTATGALITTFTGNLNGSTKAVTATNSTVYVGGSFTTANGVAHQHLAAFSSAGAVLSWKPSTSASVTPTNPTATAIVTAIVLAPDGSRVIVAGKFDHLDSDARTGLGAVDAVTGADDPWAASNPIADFGATSNLTSLTADATQVYGSGYYFTHGGNFEGRFAVDPDTGAINWMDTCHGDSYATFPMGQVLYSASHEHECSDIGAFSQTTPGPIQAEHHFGEAETTYATGTLHPAIFTVGGGPTYYNFGGEPSGTQLDWYPTFTEGTYTGQSQAAWSVSGNSKYISYGGEFPTVNGTKQQGLVRFAISSIASNKVGPTGLVAPTVVSQSSGTARIGWEAAWDQDNTTLTYAVTRDSSTTPIYTTTVNSTFYNRPALSYVDKNLTTGSSHSYKVRVTDPFGNTVLSAATSVTIGSATTDPYTASVLASGPIAFWPLSESAGSALAYDHAGGADLTMGAHGTFGVAGPHAGSTAVSFQGDPTIPGSFIPPATIVNPVYSASTSGSFATAPPLATYSVEAWVKTTSTTGGMIAGAGLWQTTDSQTEDRVLYFDTSGDLRFGAYNNGPTDAGLKSTIVSPTAYNDGTWHHVVGTLGAGGAALYVDGVKVASDSTMVDTSSYFGNWRVGGDILTGWPSAPTNGYLAGSIADVAVYPTALSAATVLSHYNGGSAGSPVAAFTSSCTALSCTFDASGSTDVGGTITGYSWSFGDGNSGTGAHPTHVYASAGTDNVTLTVTDNTLATNAISHNVSPLSGTGVPTAAFTSNCTNLSCAFDGTTSSDVGGSITDYSWSFGDGGVSTDQSPTHVYASANTYSVTLTVTDSTTSQNSISHNVAPTAAPPPSTPVAAFTSNCTALSCVFDGSTSTDTGGATISTYTWDFGDGTSDTGVNPTHVYGSAATYNVKLTVLDNLSDTNTANANVSPTSGVVTLFASDTFNRTVAGGLGTADLGGAWTRVGGTAANLSVAPGAASFLMPSPSVQDSAYLGSVSQTTTETDTTFTDTNVSTGTAGVYVYVDGRRVSTNNEYDGRIRLTPTGGVAVELTKYAGSATATAITSEVTLAGVTFAPGTLINVRFQVSGTSPTTLKVKVWPSTSAQPAAWTLTATDTSAGLQAAGAVGLTTYLSGSTTNAPTTVKFSSFSAGPLQP